MKVFLSFTVYFLKVDIKVVSICSFGGCM